VSICVPIYNGCFDNNDPTLFFRTFFSTLSASTQPNMEDDQLLDYEEENEEQMETADKAENGGAPDAKKAKGHYASIHSSGFRDLMLRPELLRAVIDCGFDIRRRSSMSAFLKRF